MEVVLKSSSGAIAGRVFLYFTSPPQYYLGYCSESQTEFLPADHKAVTDNIWTLTLKKNSDGDRNVVVQCNNEEVFNVVLSEETCGYGDWSEYWSKDIAKIGYSIADTASDFYRLKAGMIHTTDPYSKSCFSKQFKLEFDVSSLGRTKFYSFRTCMSRTKY